MHGNQKTSYGSKHQVDDWKMSCEPCRFCDNIGDNYEASLNLIRHSTKSQKAVPEGRWM